jgi:hypothetical protein
MAAQESATVVAVATQEAAEARATYAGRENREPLRGGGFDELTIKVEPRFKDSPASGSEWRFSAIARAYHKGRFVHEQSYGDMKTAMTQLGALLGDTEFWSAQARMDVSDLCDQPGCKASWTRTFRLKQLACACCGHQTPPDEALTVRKFCDRHAKRGTQSLDDCDDNYEEIAAGSGPRPPPTVHEEDKPGPYVPIDDSDSD